MNHDHHDHNDDEQHQGNHGHKHHEIMFRNKFWISLALSIPILIYSETIQGWLGFDAPAFTGSEYITPLFSVIVFIYGGLPFLDMARPEIEKREPGMMTLISMAISVSFIYSLLAFAFDLGSGFFWEMATLIVVMLLGHWFEMRSVRQASGALDELASLMPDTAERITENDETETVKVTELNEGDIVLIRPGASIPADGIVVEGQSRVNEAMITGESKPVKKSVDKQVIGGTINGDGSLRVKVEATGDSSALAGIMRLVEEAQNSKSDTQKLADRAAGWLFYLAVSVALITAVAWTIAVGFDVEVLKRVVTVLVIACPHALGLAIPLVVAISTSMAARNGILIRDRIALEHLRDINVVVFDKTGTLTAGEQGVVNQLSREGLSDDEALSLTAAIERDSEHMIAKAIVKHAQDQEVQERRASDFEAIQGRGAKANIDDDTYYVGGPQLLDQLGISLPDTFQTFTDEAGEQGQGVVYLIKDEQIQTAFALADVIREESKEAVKALREMNLKVAMLTGDSEAVAKSVAKTLEIDEYFAEVLPEHKDEKIQSLQRDNRKVMMVGDGINDAPALSRADVGMAIGSGTDVAVESAGIILVNSNPLDVVRAIELSHATYRKMWQNLLWATGYNLFALPLAAGILAPVGFLLSPAVGALFMSLSTIIVALNAQLLRRWAST